MAGGGPTAAIQRSNSDGANVSNCSRPAHSDALMCGLNRLRCSDKLLDVSLIVEGRTFKAHRAVLAACSDYFCAMFTDAMREARQTEIKLNGVSARGIEMLLEYAYTAKLELDRSNVQDVLAVSTHVQMKAVIDACSTYLESQIDLENCVAIASLADLYCLETLKKKTYRYICSRLDEFAHTPDLCTLTVDQLEYMFACNYPVDCAEERVLQIAVQYCHETKTTPEAACGLFSLVRFNHIDACGLSAVVETFPGSLFHQVVRGEAHRQQQHRRRHHSLAVVAAQVDGVDCEDGQVGGGDDGEDDDYDDAIDGEVISTDVLTNSRGMELALVKIGGFETNGLTNQISCYLPSKGKWEILTVIPHIEQCNYGTAVLGNDLYVVGGSYDVCLKEYIHPFGFRYCPTQNKWKTISPIQADRCRFSLNAMGTNFLYAVGGVCELNDHDDGGGGGGGGGMVGGVGAAGDHWAADMALLNCERYNAITDRWEYMPPLVENRSQHAGIVLGEQLYISGGIDRHMVLASLWRFDTKAEKWHKLCQMPTPRADHVLLTFEGRIYACGGWYEDPLTEMRVLVETIDVYDVARDQWSVESRNPMPKYYTGVAAVKRKIYFIGGLMSNATINRATSAVQCYDLDTQEWSYNSEWEYPKEVWECTCAAFYVPRERDDFKYYWGEV